MRFFILPFILLSFLASAQKPSLKIEDFDHWKSIRQTSVSRDGNFCGYLLEPGKGNSSLVIHNLKSNATDTFKNISNWSFTGNGKFLVATVVTDFEKLRALKLEKVKKEDLPKDSIFWMDLQNRNVVGKPDVVDWKVNAGFNSYLVMRQEPTLDTAMNTADKPNKPGKKSKTKTMVYIDCAANQEEVFEKVDQYSFSENGKLLMYNTDGDSLAAAGIYVFDTDTRKINTLKEGEHRMAKIALDTAGISVAYIADFSRDKKKPNYELGYWSQKSSFESIMDSNNLNLGWCISEHGKLSFSPLGTRIIFGTRPKQDKWEKDSSLLDEELAKLDVWSHHDFRLQPEQKLDLEKDQKKSYKALWDLKKKLFIQIESEETSSSHLAREGEGDFALLYDSKPYEKARTWEYPWARDVYLLDLKNGNKKLITKKQKGRLSISPQGKYVIWYDFNDSNWHSLNTKNGNKIKLTNSSNNPFYDEDDDHPAQPRSYGTGGWTENDAFVFIYDKYDVWQIDPSAKIKPKRISNGRTPEIRTRLVRRDRAKDFYAEDESILLSKFDFRTKESGFTYFNLSQPNKAYPALMQNASIHFSTQNISGSVQLFTKGTSVTYPDLYLLEGESKLNRISDANPQQAKYNWYKTELVEYLSADGIALQGILYLPENLDPNKKYPMITYFYERMSDYYHSYQSPRPSRSTISRSFYASNGYIIFVPDIVYEDGQPGNSAFNCIVPGVLKMVNERNYIDKERLALQGQSWGGYQTAQLITQTDLFACAMAGAPVSNMTSAYGGIRWGSGLSRAFQYERAQSRIGGSLWEKPWNYIENSPVFYANRVNTPLLIMHNDADGAVPWYQGIEYFNALRRLNRDVWMLVYNNEAHNLTKWPNRVDLSNRMFGFFNYYLKAEPEPDWMAQGVPAIKKGKEEK